MMNFASQEPGEWHESNNFYESAAPSPKNKHTSQIASVKLFADKLGVPAVGEPIARPRLTEHLEKSLERFSATLITGRTGTGKTALAADFARQSGGCVAWYKVETADVEWEIFSRYLSASLEQNCSEANFRAEFAGMEVSAASEVIAAHFNAAAAGKPVLIVLDDLHSVFDAEWFGEFFHSFVPLLAPNVRFLLIARTLPPLQIWRLRSKQVLGVLDEKLLSFTETETIELFRKYELPPNSARTAHKSAYGKIARLSQIIEKTAAAPPSASVSL